MGILFTLEHGMRLLEALFIGRKVYSADTVSVNRVHLAQALPERQVTGTGQSVRL